MDIFYLTPGYPIINGIYGDVNYSTRELAASCVDCNDLWFVVSSLFLGSWAILQWVVVNADTSYDTFDFAVRSHLHVWGSDYPTCRTTTGGFSAGDYDITRLTFTTSLSHVFDQPVPGFWFGDYGSLSDYIYGPAVTSSESPYSGDSAMSIFWNNVGLEAGQRKVFSLMVRWGDASTTIPTITVDAPSILYTLWTYEFSVTISHALDELCYLLMVIPKYYNLVFYSSELRLGSFTDSIDFSTYNLSFGTYDLCFYAVTESGTLSTAYNVSVDVVQGGTRRMTRSRSPSPVETPTSTPTATLDTRLLDWQVGLIVAAALIIVLGIIGRVIFGFCNFCGKEDSVKVSNLDTDMPS
jgi:hypothetical protein